MPPPPRCRLCAQAGEGLREFALKTSNSTKTLGVKAGESLAKAGEMSSTICANPGGRRTTAETGFGLPPKTEEDDADADDNDDGDVPVAWFAAAKVRCTDTDDNDDGASHLTRLRFPPVKARWDEHPVAI